jgi:hypothetical protein
METDRLLSWLLSSSPYTEYNTRLELLNQSPDDSAVLTARRKMLVHPQIQTLLKEVEHWPGNVLKNHKDASHCLHKLVFLADVGLRLGDPEIGFIVERILAHQSQEGPFQVLVNINPTYGGKGEDQWSWMLCDAPLVLYILLKFGMSCNDEQIRKAKDYLLSLVRENGWPCSVAPDLGNFRGPGRKADPCPIATLQMLKVLALIPNADPQIVRTGIEMILGMWEKRREQKHYLFAMGTDFNKLKAPIIWFDILNTLDVLTQFPSAISDPRLQEMLAVVNQKSDESGQFTPESIWTAWKEWDFGQKKLPSPWLTFLMLRVMRRSNYLQN